MSVRFSWLVVSLLVMPIATMYAQSYQLVWADEFDYTGNLDTSKWFHQTQLPIPGSWYNGEIQH